MTYELNTYIITHSFSKIAKWVFLTLFFLACADPNLKGATRVAEIVLVLSDPVFSKEQCSPGSALMG